jgi:YD repeat-containing protein
VDYDAAGNETPRHTEISPRNHLLTYEGPEMKMTYAYDGRGVRTTRFQQSKTIADLWTVTRRKMRFASLTRGTACTSSLSGGCDWRRS